MTNEKTSWRLYDWWREAAEKYDYFVAGLAAALAGYLGQGLQTVSFASIPDIFELAAVSLFIAATIAAVKQIQAAVHLLRLETQRMQYLETHQVLNDAIESGQPVFATSRNETLSPKDAADLMRSYENLKTKIEPVLKKVQKRAEFRSTLRSWLLISGFIALVLARVSPALVCH